MAVEAGTPYSDDEVVPKGVEGPVSPDMKINPGGQIDNEGNEIGNVDGTAQGLGGVGNTTAGGGGPTGTGGGTVPGGTRDTRQGTGH
jgi:hypothetical protein